MQNNTDELQTGQVDKEASKWEGGRKRYEQERARGDEEMLNTRLPDCDKRWLQTTTTTERNETQLSPQNCVQ